MLERLKTAAGKNAAVQMSSAAAAAAAVTRKPSDLPLVPPIGRV